MDRLGESIISTPQRGVRSQRLAILEYARKHDLRIDDFIETTASGRASETGLNGKYQNPVRQANWRKAGGESPPERRSNLNHVSPRAVRRSSRGVRRSVGSGSCGRAVEHRKGTCPGCRGFRIGRRQHRWPRYGEWSASPAVSENPCTHESLSSGPGRPPPHLGLSAGVAKGRQNCRSRRRTGRRSQTRS